MIARIALFLAGAAFASQSIQAPAPQYTADQNLTFPADYREWVYLSSGLGMTYGPTAASNTSDQPSFDNVFVNPAAYRSFLQNGTWPDKTVLVLEIRNSESHGSINRSGHFQGEVDAVEVEVKDQSKPEKWRFYSFEGGAQTGKLIPATASCYSCHAQKGAVDNTFVQFYPTLKAAALHKRTLRLGTEHN